MSDEPRVTQSRTAHLQAPYAPGPDSKAARGQRASRSPPPTATDTQFFPEMAAANPAATTDEEEFPHIATEAWLLQQPINRVPSVLSCRILTSPISSFGSNELKLRMNEPV